MERKEKKEINKGRRKEEERKKKEMKQRSRFFSYLGYPCLGATQWPWSLAPTWGFVENSLGQTVVCFQGTFGCQKL